MFTCTKMRLLPHSYPFRWTARASAIILFAVWLAFITYEFASWGVQGPATNTYGQAACLAMVFAGYAVGWRKELAGGIAAIVGTLAFFVVVLATSQEMPGVAVLLFAIPGVLYLLAWHYDERQQLRL